MVGNYSGLVLWHKRNLIHGLNKYEFTKKEYSYSTVFICSGNSVIQNIRSK